MKIHKYKILLYFLVCLIFLLVFQYTFAGLWEEIKPPSIPEMAASDQEPGVLIANVVTWIMGFIGAIAVGFIVFGAIRYITSAGNEKMVEEAKKIILYAIIGFVIAILAVVIVQVVGREMAYPCDKIFEGYSCIEGKEGDVKGITDFFTQCKTGKKCNGEYCCGENIDLWCCKP